MLSKVDVIELRDHVKEVSFLFNLWLGHLRLRSLDCWLILRLLCLNFLIVRVFPSVDINGVLERRSLT